MKIKKGQPLASIDYNKLPSVTTRFYTLPHGLGRIVLVAVIVGLLSSVLAVFSWSNPTATPPGGNVPAPINVSTTTQTKSGGLNVLGNVGIGTTGPNPVALLDLYSTSKGFLAPRMTTAQRDAISSPPAGLMIYNTTTNQYESYNGTSW